MLTLPKLELHLVAALVLFVFAAGLRAPVPENLEPPAFATETEEVYEEVCYVTKIGYLYLDDGTVMGNYGWVCPQWSFATDLVPYQTVSFEPNSAP